MAARTRAFAGALIAIGAIAVGPEPAPGHRTWLWAWERAEDLTWLDEADHAGVAFLAATIELHAGGAHTRWRAHPVRIPAHVPRIAVLRIEQRRGVLLEDPARARAAVVRVAREVSALPAVGGVQIDFDARASQRDEYRALLHALRRALPKTRLTITALAGWCLGDDWLSDATLPIDGVVPMVFTMGRESPVVYERLEAAPFPVARCRERLGVAAGEPQPPRRGAEIWAFSSRPWTRARFEAVRGAER